MRLAVRKIVKKFLAETTLHGFKYLRTPFYSDWLGWTLWISACVVCAGILCSVLWARFLDSPTLLVILDPRDEATLWFPAIVICASPNRLAQLFQRKMSVQGQHNVSLPTLFHNLVRGRPMTQSQATYLDHVLTTHNMTLREALMRITEPCRTMVQFCRLRDRILPCQKYFTRHITPSGVCCIALAYQLNKEAETDLSSLNPTLELHLQCSDESIPNGCEFRTMFSNELHGSHVSLINGYLYRAHLTFTLVKDSSKGKLFDGGCLTRPNYNRKQCFKKCKEWKCGCSDPLATKHDFAELPPCSISRLRCLKLFKLIDDKSCNCPLSCDRISTTTLLESSPITPGYTFDPLYDGANSSSVILSITSRQSWSKMFNLRYTETWWSLLSSLGGVFNMFLGVGAISVLELLFWLAKPLRRRRRRPGESAASAPAHTTVPLAHGDMKRPNTHSHTFNK